MGSKFWKLLPVALILAVLLLVLLWPSPVQTTEIGKAVANWVASWFTSQDASKNSVLAQLEIFLNVLMFVPFSLSVFLILKRNRAVISLVASLILSVSAELVQKYCLTARVASIQDVGLNVTGAGIGIGIGFLITRLRRKS
jgi:glycopeptide antibiotics resistance protein